MAIESGYIRLWEPPVYCLSAFGRVKTLKQRRFMGFNDLDKLADKTKEAGHKVKEKTKEVVEDIKK